MVEKKAATPSRVSALARTNPWMVSTFVLGVLFLIALFVATTGTGSVTGNVLSSEEVGQKVLGALNAQTGGGVTLGSVAQEGGLYKVTVSYQGDSVPVYATLDGTKLAFQVIALDGSGSAPVDTAEVPTDQPVVIDPEMIKNAPYKGDVNAPITIVEFSDFECPFCERFVSGAMPSIEEAYLASGMVKLVFMQFPLNFHPEAQKAAEASLCVYAQKGNDGFWKMHDVLFMNQADLSVENYKQWARELGIGVDGSRFDRCLDNGEFESRVGAELAYGQSLGVSGTPSFFVNGVPLVGAQPFTAFKQVIDAQLAG